MIREELRATVGILEGDQIGIDPELVVDCREDFLQVDRAILGSFAEAVGRSDHLSMAESPASQEEEAGLGPVIAASIAVDSGRPSELARQHDDGIVQPPRVFQVFHQTGEAIVEAGKFLPHGVEVFAVRIPPADGKRHVPHPHIDEAAGEEKVLAIAVPFDVVPLFDAI